MGSNLSSFIYWLCDHGKRFAIFFTFILLVCMCSVASNSLWPHRLKPARLLYPWNFSRPQYWGRLPFATPGDLPNLRIKPTSLTFLALVGRFLTNCPTWEDLLTVSNSVECYHNDITQGIKALGSVCQVVSIQKAF